MFIASLFTIAKAWKQLKCPSTDAWYKEDVVHTYNGILLSHKENEIMSFAATWMDLEVIILSEVSETEKDKYHDKTYMWNLKKMIQMNLFPKQKQTHVHRKPFMVTKEERGEG